MLPINVILYGTVNPHIKGLLNYREKEYLPSGSGIDAGTCVEWDECTKDQVVLKTSFHHMDESGFYDGWTDHTIVFTHNGYTGSFDIDILGEDRNDIHDYLCDTYRYALLDTHLPKSLEQKILALL